MYAEFSISNSNVGISQNNSSQTLDEHDCDYESASFAPIDLTWKFIPPEFFVDPTGWFYVRSKWMDFIRSHDQKRIHYARKLAHARLSPTRVAAQPPIWVIYI